MAGKTTDKSASQMIDERIRALEDWRGPVLKRMRALIHEADPEVIEDGSGRRRRRRALPSGPTTAAFARANPTNRS